MRFGSSWGAGTRWTGRREEHVVEIERIGPLPVDASLADPELVALVDSLRPATYDEVRNAYPLDDAIEQPGVRYDEPKVCQEDGPEGPVWTCR